MNIIFFGSSKFSTISEKKLHEKFGLQLVVTVPDSPSGRHHEMKPSPVKVFAQDHNIPVITANKLTEDVIGEIKRSVKPHPNPLLKGEGEQGEKSNIDFLVVADYGLIIPQKLLDLPTKAAINIHHSLLPKFRGPTPVPSTILAGEKITGVTIMKIVRKVDAGDILAQKEYALDGTETTDFLLEKLNELGAEILIPVLQNYDVITPIPQDESRVTYSPMLNKESGYIDLSSPSNIEHWKLIIEQATRAYFPWPGVWTKLRIKNPSNSAGRQEVRVKFLPETMIQPEGKKPMRYQDFVNGYPEGKKLLEKLGLI